MTIHQIIIVHAHTHNSYYNRSMYHDIILYSKKVSIIFSVGLSLSFLLFSSCFFLFIIIHYHQHHFRDCSVCVCMYDYCTHHQPSPPPTKLSTRATSSYLTDIKPFFPFFFLHHHQQQHHQWFKMVCERWGSENHLSWPGKCICSV